MKRNTALLMAIGLLAFTATNTVLANCCPSFFTGFYAGAGLGGLETYGNINSNVLAGQIRSINLIDVNEGLNLGNAQNGHVYKASWLGLLDVGYGYVIGASNVYLGLEAYASTATRNVNLANTTTLTDVVPAATPPTVINAVLSTNSTASLNNTEYGIDFRPGYVWCKDTLFYGRIGAAFNRATIHQRNTLVVNYPDADITTPLVSTLNTNRNKNVVGLRLGLGVEQHVICQNLTVSLDYVYTDYGSIDTSGIDNVNSLGPIVFLTHHQGVRTTRFTTRTFTGDNKAKLSSNALFLGVKYYFG